MEVFELKAKKQKYIVLLRKVKNTVSNLKKSKNSISDAKSLGNYYSIDNEPVDEVQDIKNISNEIENIIDDLENRVIPWIERKISKTKSQITDALEAEKE